jgi:hypothetical protein
MEKLFTKEECKSLIGYVEKNHTWQRREQNLPISIKYYQTKLVFDEIPFIYERLKQYVKNHLKIDSGGNDNIIILKYTKGDLFARHIDLGNLDFTSDFIYNVNMVLNDDFKGGEFYLDDKKFEGNDIGVVYHYPSTVFHEVKEVKDGFRYSMLYYIRKREIKNKNEKSLL